MGDLREPNGGVVEERPLPLPSTLIGPERWAEAERATEQIICKVQPTHVSEERRRKVVDYVQRLTRGFLGCEVFSYGSVPLKTYLPDGDIDLTAFGGTNIEDVLANDMVSVLEGEEQNEAAEFVVKDVQLIRAEVKLVKCIVQNIVVDISINQIGGLCTLCFLEQVDRLIGKDHLFKRSIILIKAWCYYESRILGAHHGLISTYALETLVLYIFHLFHSTLDGPLAVLYKFLDYFSKFDWENYCISLTGPVRISSLPDIVAETPENGLGDLLLSSDFLGYCIDMFSVPSRGMDMGSRAFPQKHLNIIDPLKENNNLGRSVSKGNFYRIRSAFAYGARKLGRILLHPEYDIADELLFFFSNTLERHGHGQRPDVQDSGPLSNCNRFSSSPEIPVCGSSQAVKVISERKATYLSKPEDSRISPDVSSHGVGSKVSGMRMVDGEQKSTKEGYHSTLSSETNGRLVSIVGDHCHLENTEDRTSSKIQGHMISNDIPRISASSVEESVSARGKPYHAPHLYFTNSLFCNGELNLDPKQLGNCKEKISSKTSQGPDDIDCVPDENLMDGRAEILLGGSKLSLDPNAIPFSEDNSCTACGASSSGSPASTNSLSDLSGDYNGHFSCLQYGRWSYEHGVGAPVLSLPMPQPHFQMQISCDAIQHPPHSKQNGYSHGNASGVIPSSAIYTMNHLVMPGVAFGLADLPKPRGTGTYFPYMNRPPHGYRSSAAKGRNQPLSRSPRNNGRNAIFTESSNHDRSSHELPLSEVHVDQIGVKHHTYDVQQSFSSPGKGRSRVNGLVVQSEGFAELGSAGQLSRAAPFPERGRQQRFGLSSPNSAPASPTQGVQKLNPVFSHDHNRVSMKSVYGLKNEDDFPPLSV